MQGVIYIIKNKLNGKVYIGQTIQNPKDRWYRHCAKSNISKNEANMHIKRAILKYGKENFSFEVIETCLKEQLNEREIYWINYYDSYNKGYNNTLGGSSGTKPLKINREEFSKIKNLYLDEFLTLKEIADKYNVDKATIKHILYLQKVKLRTKTYKYKEDFLIELLNSGKSLRKIESEYGISRGYLSTFKKKHRI